MLRIINTSILKNQKKASDLPLPDFYREYNERAAKEYPVRTVVRLRHVHDPDPENTWEIIDHKMINGVIHAVLEKLSDSTGKSYLQKTITIPILEIDEPPTSEHSRYLDLREVTDLSEISKMIEDDNMDWKMPYTKQR